jgi:hypothetical protein
MLSLAAVFIELGGAQRAAFYQHRIRRSACGLARIFRYGAKAEKPCPAPRHCGAGTFQALHAFCQRPERAVEAHILVNAIDGAGLRAANTAIDGLAVAVKSSRDNNTLSAFRGTNGLLPARRARPFIPHYAVPHFGVTLP